MPLASLAPLTDAIHWNDIQEADALGAKLERVVKMNVIPVDIPRLRIRAQFPLQAGHGLASETAVEEILHQHFQFPAVHKRLRLTASWLLIQFLNAARIRNKVTRRESTGRPLRAANSSRLDAE